MSDENKNIENNQEENQNRQECNKIWWKNVGLKPNLRTDNYAIEFDFAKKWAEAVGQSLYYAEVLQKNPGIVLISENGEKDQKFIKRLNSIAEKFGITVWIIKPEELKK